MSRIRRGVTLVLATFALAGCGARTPPATGGTSANGETAAVRPGAVTAKETLPFIHDDYPKALAEAKAKKKPLFVDAWATWCHSCQSLRTFVLTDAKLAPMADAFVWLSIDTEKDQNAEWVQKHPHAALPTLWVVDPATDRPILKWAGTVTADELTALLGVAVADASAEKTAGATAPAQVAATSAFVRGNQLLAADDAEGAEKAHREALGLAAKDHPHRARIVETLVTQLAIRKKHAECAEVASAEAAGLPPGTSRASTLVAGLGCAREANLPDAASRLLDTAMKDASARDASLLPDDRSALYDEIVTTKKARGEKDAVKAIAKEWSAFLDDAAAKAKSADARASLDPLRLSAYFALEEYARALPMLEASERDFPDDYNPPARLGRVYLELKRLDEAERATERAIARVYGPRAMRVYALRADIAKARGDRPGEVRALEEALAKSEKAVLTAGQKQVRDAFVKRLAGLK